LAIFGLMMFSILPSFENILKEREVEVPFITRVILSFSKTLREKSLHFVLILGAFIILIFYYLKTEEGRKFFDKISLKIPFFGEISKQTILSRFAQNLSTLTSAGLSLTEALEIVEEIVGNKEYKKAISKIKEGIKKGEAISSITALYPELFPPLFTQLVLVGEKTGTLSNSLSAIANFYQSETEKSIENFLRILEPLLIIILGALVGGLMLSVLLPLYRIIGTY